MKTKVLVATVAVLVGLFAGVMAGRHVGRHEPIGPTECVIDLETGGYKRR